MPVGSLAPSAGRLQIEVTIVHCAYYCLGVVRGVLSPETGTREFFGIPYGKSPHGDRRFMPPEAADRWSGVKDATKQRDGCLRAGWRGVSGTEDCLYVNVHAPLPTQPCHPEGGLPVM